MTNPTDRLLTEAELGEIESERKACTYDRDYVAFVGCHADRLLSHIRAQSAALSDTESWLGNLLARIHRDGGHTQAEVGTSLACQRADDEVVRLLGIETALTDRDETIRRLEGALEDIHSWLVCWPIARPEDMAQSFETFEIAARAALAPT